MANHVAPPSVALRPVAAADLTWMYLEQSDEEANAMAVANPRDERTFFAHWAQVLVDPAVVARVIVVGGEPVGQVSRFVRDGQNYVGYWIRKEHWGKGFASAGLAALLQQVRTRPLLAMAAVSNVASIRVLERCGFVCTGRAWANATERFPACEEAWFRLD